MRTTTVTRSIILGGVLAGTLGFGAVQLAAGDTGTSPTHPRELRQTSASPASAPAPTRTVTERGIVLEGTGTWRDRPVRVFVYENQHAGNSLQIVVGDPDGRHAIGSGEGRDPYVIDGVLNVGLDVDGDLAVVKGTVTRAGAPRPATEPARDGDLVASTGTHTPLRVDATFEYRGETVALQFAKAVEYDLRSTRTATD